MFYFNGQNDNQLHEYLFTLMINNDKGGTS